MTNPRAGDVPALLRHFGVPITHGLVTVKGIVDRAGEPVLGGQGGASAIGSRSVIVQIQQGSLPGLEVGGTVTVDGAPLLVAAMREIDDGELIALHCVTSS